MSGTSFPSGISTWRYRLLRRCSDVPGPSGRVAQGCVARSAGAWSQSAAGDAATPAAQRIVFARKVPAVDFDTVSRAFGDRPSKCDVHAEVRQDLARA